MHKKVIMRAIVPLAVIKLAVVPPHAGADSGGGDNEPVNRVTAWCVERWAVKTGTDADARLVNQKAVVPTSIIHLRGLPAPPQPPLRRRVRPVETAVWAVDAILLRYREEAE